MPARMMGVISCQLFEDELMHLISRDEDIVRVFVIRGDDSHGILEKLGRHPPKCQVEVVDVSEVASLQLPEGFSLLLWIKPMALHSKPEKLNQEVIDSIGLLEKRCGSLLLFYGLCGNAFRKFEKTMEPFSIPVVILRDAKGEIVDDCIGTVLGGTEEYYQMLKRSSGTFFLTPMWAEHWRELFHKVQILPDPSDIEGAKYIFQNVGYKKVMKLDTGLGDQERFESNIDEFASIFEFTREDVVCELHVIEDSYDKAKRLA
jgi:hypothetical protein